MSDNEWSFWLIFHFFPKKEETSSKHPEENSLTLEGDLEEGLLN